MSCFLITRPNHDLGTIYLSVWSEEIILLAKKKGHNVLDLDGNKANRSIFNGYIKSQKPSFILLNGHGNADEVTGINNEVVLDKNTPSEDISGVIIYARSCNAGENLGPLLIGKGARAFVGYTTPFSVMSSCTHNSRPLSDPLAKLFIEPSNLLITSILKGNSIIDSHRRSIGEMKKNLSILFSQGNHDSAAYLYSNIVGQVVHGNENSRL